MTVGNRSRTSSAGAPHDFFNVMNSLRRATLLLAVPLVLAACGQKAPTEATPAGAEVPSPAAMPTRQPATLEAAAKFAKGFETGNLMSARKVYVFFDPQCPHCAVFWNEAKKLEKDVRFIWVPVGLLSAKSTLQGATILNDRNPLLAMEEHEALLMSQKGGIVPANITAAEKVVIDRNTKLLVSFGAEGVPYLVTTTADGRPYSGNGMSAEQLVATLGWRTSNIPSTAPRAGAPEAIAPASLPPTTVGDKP